MNEKNARKVTVNYFQTALHIDVWVQIRRCLPQVFTSEQKQIQFLEYSTLCSFFTLDVLVKVQKPKYMLMFNIIFHDTHCYSYVTV
jgi:hypothetical protein